MENDDDVLNSDTPVHVYDQLNELEIGVSTFLPGKLEQISLSAVHGIWFVKECPALLLPFFPCS